LKAKIGDHRLHRKIALEGHRYSAPEALQDGILDYTVKGKTADILAKAEEIADKFGVNAAMGVWGLIKVVFYEDSHLLLKVVNHLIRETCIVRYWKPSTKTSDW
jgi:enoyl-CoA hydratase/carnithine racemase